MSKPPHDAAIPHTPAWGIVSDASPAKIIANYSIDRTIGQGTYGKVKLGIHLVTGEKAAVKIIEKSQIKSPKQVARVQREIRFLKLLHHPHIISVYDVIETDAFIYILTEYAVGGELFDYIVSNKRIAEDEARRFFRMVAGAVSYCHQNAVIHRDLKPENLLLDENKSIKLIDFGFANNYKTDGSQLDTFCGSPFYAAPEMILGKKYTGPEVDLWSLGVILFTMLCGHLPFDDDNLKQLYRKIAVGKYVVPDYVSPTARHLMSRLIHTHAQTRATMRELVMHPWINSGYTSSISAHIPTRPAMGEPVTLDEGIVRRLEAFGYKRKSVEEAFARRQARGRDRRYIERELKADDDGSGDESDDECVLGDSEEDVCATYFLFVEMLARQERRGRGTATTRDAKCEWVFGPIISTPTRDSVATCVEGDDAGVSAGSEIAGIDTTMINVIAASSTACNLKPRYLPASLALPTGLQFHFPSVPAFRAAQIQWSNSPGQGSQNNSKSQLPDGKQPVSSIRDFLLGKFLVRGNPKVHANETIKNGEYLNAEAIKRKKHYGHEHNIRRRAHQQPILKSNLNTTFANATHNLTQLLNKSQQGVLRFWSVNPRSTEIHGVSIFSIECEMDSLKFQTEQSQLGKQESEKIQQSPGERERNTVTQDWATDNFAQSRHWDDSVSYGESTEVDKNELIERVGDLQLMVGKHWDPHNGGGRESSRSAGTDELTNSEGYRMKHVIFHIEIVSRDRSKKCEIRFFAVLGEVSLVTRCAEILLWQLNES